MGKTTSYTPVKNSTYSINGVKKASTTIDGNNVYANYNMNEYEKKLYDYAQKTLSDVVPNVNVFSSNDMKEIQSKVNAYKNQSLNDINSMYTPIINNLKNFFILPTL